MDYHRSFIFRFSEYKNLNKFIKKIFKEKNINLDKIKNDRRNNYFLSTKILKPSSQIIKT